MKTLVLRVLALALSTGFACNGDISTPSKAIKRDDSAYPLGIDLSGSLQNPAFSPDGTSIVFTRFRDGYNQGKSDLYIYNLETKKLSPLVSDGAGNVNLPGSAWNAAINSVVFSSEREPHDEIFFISATGTTGDEIKITNRQKKQSYEPTFSPDGKWIVFESHAIDVENDGMITKYKIDGSSEYIDLTTSNANCKQPNWSPVGDKILYQKIENGRWSIWMMDIQGKNKTKITSSNESATDAVFSNDGQWIIYSSENDAAEPANIFKISSSGGAPMRMTRYKGYDGAPSISPDGGRIAFESTNGDPEESKGTALWIIDISPTYRIL